MKSMKAIGTLLILFVTLPIWYYLLYQVLVRVNASELMWFLFWAYLPISFLSAFLVQLATKD